jgi:hypothetical protein
VDHLRLILEMANTALASKSEMLLNEKLGRGGGWSEKFLSNLKEFERAHKTGPATQSHKINAQTRSLISPHC